MTNTTIDLSSSILSSTEQYLLAASDGGKERELNRFRSQCESASPKILRIVERTIENRIDNLTKNSDITSRKMVKKYRILLGTLRSGRRSGEEDSGDLTFNVKITRHASTEKWSATCNYTGDGSTVLVGSVGGQDDPRAALDEVSGFLETHMENVYPELPSIGFEVRNPDGDLIVTSGHVSERLDQVVAIAVSLLGRPLDAHTIARLNNAAYEVDVILNGGEPIMAEIQIQSGTRTWNHNAGAYEWDTTDETLFNLTAFPASSEVLK